MDTIVQMYKEGSINFIEALTLVESQNWHYYSKQRAKQKIRAIPHRVVAGLIVSA